MLKKADKKNKLTSTLKCCFRLQLGFKIILDKTRNKIKIKASNSIRSRIDSPRNFTAKKAFELNAIKRIIVFFANGLDKTKMDAFD